MRKEKKNSALKISTRCLAKKTCGELKAVSSPQVAVYRSAAGEKPAARQKGQRWTAARGCSRFAETSAGRGNKDAGAWAVSIFFFFSFSSSLPSSSRRWLTASFPRDGVTFRSNIAAGTCQRSAEHSAGFSLLLNCGMWPPPVCCVCLVPRKDCWARTCSRDGTELKGGVLWLRFWWHFEKECVIIKIQSNCTGGI